jgi:hypothetical protein
MAEYKANVVSDGNGGTINFPFTIFQEHMDLIEKEFVVQDDDVFVVTFPRSGTTWTEQMVHLLVHNGEQGEQRLTDAVPWLETLPHRPNGMHETLKAMHGRRLFTSHLPYPLMPRAKNTTAKYVYVARNPKDVATSFYFHDQSKGGYEGTWEEHFQLFMNGDLTFGSYFDHVLPWWETSQRNKNILFLKYEDMKNNLVDNIAKIASFLDIQADSQLIDQVVALSSFKSMSSGQNTNFDWIPQRAGVPSHFRKGDIGDWRNQFSEEQSQKLDAVFMEKMNGTGLRFDFGDGVVRP